MAGELQCWFADQDKLVKLLLPVYRNVGDVSITPDMRGISCGGNGRGITAVRDVSMGDVWRRVVEAQRYDRRKTFEADY